MVISLKSSFCKVYKVFLVLLLYIIIYKPIISIFKDFKLNIVLIIIYRYKVNSLALLLLAFTNLPANVCYTIQYSTWVGEVLQRSIKVINRSIVVYRRVGVFYRVLQWSIKAVNRSIVVYRKVRGLYKGSKKRLGY